MKAVRKLLGASVVLLTCVAGCGVAAEEVSSGTGALSEPAPSSDNQSNVADAVASESSPMSGNAKTDNTEANEVTLLVPPVSEGDELVVELQLTPGAPPTGRSVVGLRMVQRVEGNFLEVDFRNAIAPETAQYWTIEVNEKLESKRFTTSLGIHGTRISDSAARPLTVVVTSQTEDGVVLSTTGTVSNESW